jgi:hypothetical protein
MPQWKGTLIASHEIFHEKKEKLSKIIMNTCLENKETYAEETSKNLGLLCK